MLTTMIFVIGYIASSLMITAFTPAAISGAASILLFVPIITTVTFGFRSFTSMVSSRHSTCCVRSAPAPKFSALRGAYTLSQIAAPRFTPPHGVEVQLSVIESPTNKISTGCPFAAAMRSLQLLYPAGCERELESLAIVVRGAVETVPSAVDAACTGAVVVAGGTGLGACAMQASGSSTQSASWRASC